MQQASVERFSDLIGAIYDCVIAPEQWTKVLNEIRMEYGFATAVLSAYSLTNVRIGVNAASGTDPVPTMAQTSKEYVADIVEIWGGLATAWSAYDGRTASGSFHERGINSFQLVKVDGKWLVASILWQEATPENPLPADLIKGTDK